MNSRWSFSCSWCWALLAVVPLVACSDDSRRSGSGAQFSSAEDEFVANLVEEHPGLVVLPVEVSPAQRPTTRRDGAGGPDASQLEAQDVGVEVHVNPNVDFTHDLARSIQELNELRPVRVVRLLSDRITDADLEFLAEMDEVHKLIIECRRITDLGLKTVGALSGVDELRLLNCSISDEGLAELAGLDKLETLWLSSARLSGEGFSVFEGHQKLRTLYLSGSPITDQGAEQLAKVSSLTTIVATGSKITDKGMPHFSKLRRLQLLNVESTEVTPQGVVDVQTVLPKVRILH